MPHGALAADDSGRELAPPWYRRWDAGCTGGHHHVTACNNSSVPPSGRPAKIPIVASASRTSDDPHQERPKAPIPSSWNLSQHRRTSHASHSSPSATPQIWNGLIRIKTFLSLGRQFCCAAHLRSLPAPRRVSRNAPDCTLEKTLGSMTTAFPDRCKLPRKSYRSAHSCRPLYSQIAARGSLGCIARHGPPQSLLRLRGRRPVLPAELRPLRHRPYHHRNLDPKNRLGLFEASRVHATRWLQDRGPWAGRPLPQADFRTTNVDEPGPRRACRHSRYPRARRT